VAAWLLRAAARLVLLVIGLGPVTTGLAPGRAAGHVALRWEAPRRRAAWRQGT